MNIEAATSELRTVLLPLYGESETAAMIQLLLASLTSSAYNTRIPFNLELTTEQEGHLRSWLPRLQSAEPLQYILQQAHFYGLDLYVDKNVLIPRPETEELVHWILSDLKQIRPGLFHSSSLKADKTDEMKILDVGTGSGCIALALKYALPLAEVWGCDQSDAALTVARRNGADLNIRVDFQGLDFLDRAQQKQLPTVNLVVSNPPYIPATQASSMHANVVAYEPHQALFVPDEDPMVFYKALADFGEHRVYSDGIFYMEIHESLGGQVQELFTARGYKVTLRQDMQGKERMVRAAR